MLEHLFGSKTRLKLLRVFFRHPGQAFFVRELTRLLEAQINAIRRELDILIKAGLVKEKTIANQTTAAGVGEKLRKYFVLDTDSILYPEIQALLRKAQVLGEQHFLTTMQEKGGDIRLLLLTGRFTNDKRSPSDLLLVGETKERVIERLIAEYEKEFGFAIRYTTMSEKEFFERRHMMDKFLYSLFEADHVKVVNRLHI